MSNNYFHFTLGPVQGFVAQARRTRDFWAGSFLLSWLSGVAMAEVKRQKGKITFPSPSAGYLDWITGDKTGAGGPRQGGIPNRFKAFSAEVPIEFDASLVEQTVRAAWLALAGHVWQGDRLGEFAMPGTEAIWRRQHQHFWEVSWVLTPDESASSLLDQRKNWRSHYAQPEPGVKCMVMDGWQELSGAERPGLSGRQDKSLLATFWTALRASGLSGIQTDLADNEHLCALAYVKRRFVRHFQSFKTLLPSGLTVSGWKLDIGMPSVSYMAAVHWLEKLVDVASASELQALLSAAEAVNPSRDEWDTHIACLVKAWAGKGDDGLRRKLLSLDGNLFFQHVRDNPKAYCNEPGQIADMKDHMNHLSGELVKLKQAHPEFATAPLSPFYAVLLMDGDSLGMHMSNPVNQQPISAALEAFTGGTPAIVEQHNGYLIYAGGDDVLALLPLEDAMQCAAAVRQHYLVSFKDNCPAIPASISAAIEYAHVKMPLGKVLGDAHGLLDDIAKDGAGRDALAVRVWTPGGMILEWAQPWDVALEEGQPEGGNKLVVEQLAKDFMQDHGIMETGFSNKFFYRIRERFDLLNPARGKNGEYETPVLTEEHATDLLAVDFKNSADNRDISVQKAASVIAPLLRQCRAVTREPALAREQWKKSPCLTADGALLVRFLARKGIE
ncbi:MAG: type III-B CRISPR-associated protein Cas10/Cmr2 [Oxalobacteraceae bacterium]|nr:type III-B CRISPR-associated protein Cas10/Cmr2 [Oxalobacteraceae bacterium]